MHTIRVIAAGLLLLGVFLAFGRWIGGGDSSAVARACKLLHSDLADCRRGQPVDRRRARGLSLG